MIEEFVPYIWAGIIIISSYAFFHKFSDVIKERIKRNSRITKVDEKTSKSIDGQIDDMVEKAPSLLAAVNKEIEDQRNRGVSDDQMKGLLSKKQMLEFAANNKEIIDMIGKPILGKVLGWVKNL